MWSGAMKYVESSISPKIETEKIEVNTFITTILF